MEEMKFDQEEMRRLAGRYFAGEIAAVTTQLCL